jgi:cysteine synthase A
MARKAAELAAAHGWFLTRPFENEANADMHSRTTAQEILADFAGERLDYWVTGFGTGGTVKGVGRVLAKERPETKIVLAEPADAAMVSSGARQERNPDGTPMARHPSWKPHPFQGWSPDFIPKLTGDAVDAGLVDRMIAVPAPEAMHWSRQLAQKEGIFVGISSGGTFAAAIQVCKDAPKGSAVLCMLPDTGERYLTTPLFADVPVEMTGDELEILRSTPTYTDVPAAASAAAAL